MSNLLDKADDCRELAKECFDLADHATDARTRGHYEKRAQDYLARAALLTKTWIARLWPPAIVAVGLIVTIGWIGTLLWLSARMILSLI